jgi:hypothetical protein
METIRTEVTVDAPPTAVWNVLTDLDAYEEWNPQITRASGHVREGERIEIRIEPTGQRAVSMKPRVTAVDEPRKLEWVGKLSIPGVFAGRHAFELVPVDDGATRVINTEGLSGLSVRWVVDDETVDDYEAMNRALKERVESLSVAEIEAEPTRS